VEDGAPADLLAVESPGRLLEGDRLAVSLLLVRGRAVYGEPSLVAAAGRPVTLVSVDGAPRALAEPLGRRLAAILRGHPAARGAAWLEAVGL